MFLRNTGEVKFKHLHKYRAASDVAALLCDEVLRETRGYYMVDIADLSFSLRRRFPDRGRHLAWP